MKNVLLLPILALILSGGLLFAEDSSPRRHNIPSDVKEQVEAMRAIHHANIVAERTRFRAEMEKVLANNPKLLAKLKEHWSKIDSRIEERKEDKKNK